MADGEIPLRKGIQSRLQGYSVIDDSDSPLIESDGAIISRAEKAIDLYFFGYGLEYQAALNDFFELSGSCHVMLSAIGGAVSTPIPMTNT